MYKKKDKKLLIIILCVGVICISIGLAAFSSTLNIKSGLSVTPKSDSFKIKISGSETDPDVTVVEPNYAWMSNGIPHSVASNATISYSGDLITMTNINATFTTPGQYAAYYIYAHNVGAYDAYWKRGVVNNVSGTNAKVKCTAGEGATESLVQEACKNIDPRIFYSTCKGCARYGGQAHTNNLLIKKNDFLRLYIVITYNKVTDQILADGPFNVEIGDMEFLFSSVA